jgi:hypothetical protein
MPRSVSCARICCDSGCIVFLSGLLERLL